MFGKFVIISLCCVLIDAQILAEKNELKNIEDNVTVTENLMKFFQNHIDSFAEKSGKNRNEGENSNLESELKKSSAAENEKTYKKIIIPDKQRIPRDEKIVIDAADYKTSVSYDHQRSIGEILSEIFSKQTKNQNQIREIENLVKRHLIDNDGEYLLGGEMDPMVGFGGKPQGDPKRIMFGNMTIYVNKAINQAKRNLEKLGPKIYTNNPPYVIYRIPNTPIIFNLKYIEGASTLTTQGTSMGLHYFNALYTYNQFKFEEIKFHYEVQIKPKNLFTISKRLTVILENARVYMPTALENNVMIVQRFEYVKPDVTVDFADNFLINYFLNDIIIAKYYPEVRQKLAEIAQRDTKLLLDSQLENAQ